MWPGSVVQTHWLQVRFPLRLIEFGPRFCASDDVMYVPEAQFPMASLKAPVRLWSFQLRS